MKYKSPSGYEREVFETRPLVLENLNPMAHELAIKQNWLRDRVQVKVYNFGELIWVTVSKKDLIEE